MQITTNKSWGSKAGWAILFSAALGITGCGGSSSSGGGNPAEGGDNGGNNGGGTVNEQPANIQSEDDARLGANAAVESAQQAIALEDSPGGMFPGGMFPGGVTLTQETRNDWVASHSLELAELGQLPTGAITNWPGSCGGSADLDFSEGSNDLRIVYNNFCVGDGGDNQIIDGTTSWFGYTNRGTEGVWGYDADYSVSYQGETEYFNYSYRCNGDNYVGCTYDGSSYAGRNGRSYRSENVSVSESNGNYDVSARVYDEDIGYVDYQASNLVLCEGGYGFSSGTITVSDEASNEVLTVTFSGCDSFTMTYQGAGYTINY